LWLGGVRKRGRGEGGSRSHTTIEKRTPESDRKTATKKHPIQWEKDTKLKEKGRDVKNVVRTNGKQRGRGRRGAKPGKGQKFWWEGRGIRRGGINSQWTPLKITWQRKGQTRKCEGGKKALEAEKKTVGVPQKKNARTRKQPGKGGTKKMNA